MSETSERSKNSAPSNGNFGSPNNPDSYKNLRGGDRDCFVVAAPGDVFQQNCCGSLQLPPDFLSYLCSSVFICGYSLSRSSRKKPLSNAVASARKTPTSTSSR